MTLDEQVKKIEDEKEWLERQRNKLVRQVSFPILVTRSGRWPARNPAENPEIRARIEKLDGLIAKQKVLLAQLGEAKLAQVEAASSPEIRKNAVGHEKKQPGKTSKHGPKANMDRHRKIAAVVKACKAKGQETEEVVWELDRKEIPIPQAWSRWSRKPRSWKRALEYKSERVRKALDYSVSMAQREISPQL